jgi:predicted metal-binding protein
MSKQADKLSRPTPWREVVLVCRKCGKKLKGGFGKKRRDTLKTHLRQALREAGRRRDVRVIETSCLGVCPKQGVTALNATRPQTIHVIPAGTGGEAAMRTLLGRCDTISDTDRIESA